MGLCESCLPVGKALGVLLESGQTDRESGGNRSQFCSAENSFGRGLGKQRRYTYYLTFCLHCLRFAQSFTRAESRATGKNWLELGALKRHLIVAGVNVG